MNNTIGPITSLLLLFLALPCFDSMAMSPATSLFEQNGGQEKQLAQTQKIEVDQIYLDNVYDDMETKLLKERIRAAIDEIGPVRTRALEGQDAIFFLLDAQKRLVNAQLDFHKEPKKIISLLESHVKIAREIELNRKQRSDNGIDRPDDYTRAKFFRASAQLKLLRAKNKYRAAENGELPSPAPQNEDLRLLLDDELSTQGGFATPTPLSDNPNQIPTDNPIDKWKNGVFSDEVYKITNNDDEETRLKKQRVNIALMEMNHFKRLHNQGLATLDSSIECQKRLIDAQLDFHIKPKEVVAELQRAVESAKVVEAIVRDQFQAGADVNLQQVGQATYHRLDREIELLRAKEKHGLPENKK